MRGNGISGIPVTRKGRLVGILTNRDLRFERNLDQTVEQVMTTKLVTAREGVTIEGAKELLHRHRIEKLPVVNEQFELRGLITIKDIEKIQKHPNAAKDKLGRLLCGAAVGVGPDREARVAALLKAGADVIAIDTAHGHSRGRGRRGARHQGGIQGRSSSSPATWPPARRARRSAARASTRSRSASVRGRSARRAWWPAWASRRSPPSTSAPGRPIGTACPIISDGGVKYSGDVVKALAAGAASVMIGSLLAGTEEAPGEVILYQGRSYKSYRGMGSISAMKEGSKDRYFQGEVAEAEKLVPEGIEGRVPYKGPLAMNVFQLVGGLKSGMGYLGCRTIPELRQKSRFVRITSAGLKESHVHDVIIVQEAPNYRVD